MSASPPSKVLVVDDREANRYAVARTLRGAGFDVVEAASVHEALARAKEGVEVVVLDLVLPDAGGFEVCRRLKADPATEAIPVLHLSADLTGVEHRARGLEEGADAYMTHPFEPIALTALVRSLVRLRRAEAERQARRESLTVEHYRALFETHPLPMWVYDRERLAFLQVNEAAICRYGYSAEEFARMTLFDIRPPEERERLRDLLRTLPRGRSELRGFRHLRKDGTVIDVEVVSQDLIYLGRPARFAVVHDVTEQQRVARELRFQAQLFDVLEHAVIAMDEHGYVRFWNRHAERLYGWAAAEAVGRHILELTEQMENTERGAELLAESAAGRSVSGVVAVRRRDGSRFPAHVTTTPLRGPDGAFAGTVGVSFDITDQLRVEAQLRASQRMEAVGRLAGGIAHDFNNLLTVIEVNSGMLLEAIPRGTPEHEDVAGIREAAERAAALTRQLLAFGRRQVLAPQLVDAGEIVAGLERMLRRLIGEHIRVETYCDDGLWAANADPGQLEQVVLNLAVNARDAMPDGGELRIATSNVRADDRLCALYPPLPPGDYVRLTVSDTGTGMDAATRASVFEPFFTTKPQGEGTGLGLATVYGIVKQSNGFIFVDSEPGQGAAFHVFLPRACGTAVPGVSTPRHRAARGSETVLLVEDEPDVRDATARVLERLGYEVLAAPDGRQAIELAERHAGRIDGVVSDTVMPYVNGPQLASELRRRWPSLPVMLMTGYSERHVLDEASLSAPVLHKPFSIAQLGEAVRDLLDRRHED